MASTHELVLHDNVVDGADYTLPAHLIGAKWRTQHNLRLTPALQQIPRKLVYGTTSSEEIRDIAVVPSNVSGYGRVLLFGQTFVKSMNSASSFSTLKSGLTNNSDWRKWGIAVYNGSIYYSNDLNPIRENNGSSDTALANAPAARYITTWYDHMVAANFTSDGRYYPSMLACSDLYNFEVWQAASSNEADIYDCVEWQQPDYPFTGITGLGKLGGTLWVYTPTAVLPFRYVGLPKVFQLVEDQIIRRIGNTFPWTLVCLDRVHFFYDGIEKMFFAFDGQQTVPIGDPVRNYIIANLNPSLTLAAKMYGYVDVDNREIWWPFVSTTSSGAFDKAVVFNYRLKRWFTASVENVMCFWGGGNPMLSAASLVGTVAAQTGAASALGQSAIALPRIFGTSTGRILREEVVTDAANLSFLTADNPLLETADFHYGDIGKIKENDKMILNGTWLLTTTGSIEVSVRGRDFLSTDITWAAGDVVGQWTPALQDAALDYPVKYGRVLRYRFEGKTVRFLKLAAFSDSVRAKRAEK